jgi:predicted TIM-barrel fold metal-dependent hydrolase
LADVYKKQPQGFLGDPVEEVKNRIHISPFWEEDMAELAGIIGVERVLFGSDYPHPEGLADPVTYIDAIQGMKETDQAKIMGGNLARLIGV